MAKSLELINFCEKIFEKSPEAKKNKGWYFEQNGKWQWCVGFPLWLKKIDKQEAEELKKLLQDLANQQPKYNRWLPADQTIDQDGNFDQSKCKFIGSGSDGNTPNSELIQELDKIISQGGGSNPNLTKLKLSGCQCSNKDKEFEVDLKDKNYDENKDLATCPNCQSLDKYKQFKKELNLDGEKVNNKGHKISIAIIYGAKQKPQSSKTQLKFTGCRCEYRVNGENEKVFEVDLKGETYDPDKDLVACPQCQRQDKYKNFAKKDFNGNEVGNENHQITLTIIKDAKAKDKSTTEKCADCQQDKKPEELTTIQDQGKDIKVCQECKTKRDGKDNNDNSREETKKYGVDFENLKPQQQEDRKKVVNNWDKKRKKKDYWRSKHCHYCDKGFKWSKNSEYLDAEQKCQQEVDNHKKSCPLKNNKAEQEKIKQANWEKTIASTNRQFLTCQKCKGKIVYDKSIKDYKTARQQVLSDLDHHEKKECGVKDKNEWMIAVYYSPNQGGNKHAPINNSLKEEEDFVIEKDNQGEIYQEQGDNKGKGTNWTPWIIGGAVLFLVLVIGYIAWRKIKK